MKYKNLLQIYLVTCIAKLHVLRSVYMILLLLGTNDKAATAAYLQRWVSTQSIKEQTVPLTDWGYPSVDVQ